MKKKFLLLMVLLLCIGCTRINNNNYDVIVNDVRFIKGNTTR